MELTLRLNKPMLLRALAYVAKQADSCRFTHIEYIVFEPTGVAYATNGKVLMIVEKNHEAFDGEAFAIKVDRPTKFSKTTSLMKVHDTHAIVDDLIFPSILKSNDIFLYPSVSRIMPESTEVDMESPAFVDPTCVPSGALTSIKSYKDICITFARLSGERPCLMLHTIEGLIVIVMPLNEDFVGIDKDATVTSRGNLSRSIGLLA